MNFLTRWFTSTPKASSTTSTVYWNIFNRAASKQQSIAQQDPDDSDDEDDEEDDTTTNKEDPLEEARRECTALEEKLKERDAELEQTKADVARLQSQLTDAQATAQRLSRSLEDSEAAHARTTAAKTQSQTHAAAVEKRLAQTNALLATRTEELAAAQVFLGTEESYTDKQVADEVTGLNYDISQGSADVAEATARVAQWLGAELVQDLKSVDHAEDPLLLEIVFQAAMVDVARSVITAWHFGEDASHAYLDQIFLALAGQEPGAISGRWRVLTRQYSQVALSPASSDPESTLVSRLISLLASVLLAAGLGSARARTEALIRDRTLAELTDVVRIALKVNKIVGEGITSGVIAPLVVARDTAFDAEAIDDAYSGDGEKGAVLCTTSVGLKREVRAEGQVKDSTVLVKPKVALVSVLGVL
ncbi:hypothetical protein OF83DRAFT_1062081, partial [Amylostereum chailletii]